MPKREAIEYDDDSDYIKDEPSASPPPFTPPKKSRETSSSSTSTGTPSPKKNLSPTSSATTKKGVYMEMIFDAGLKAINKKVVQDETGLSPAQQQELVRKDKGALRRAVLGFVAGL